MGFDVDFECVGRGLGRSIDGMSVVWSGFDCDSMY